MSLELDDAGLRIQGKQLLDHVDLCLEPGKVVGVIGANGAGKTSLLKLAGAELPPTSGEARLDRASLKVCARESLARRIAVLPQHSMLDFPFRVDEVLRMGRIPHVTGHVVDAAIVDEVSEIMQLQAFKYRTYTTLSGGERQRVQIGRVLCQVWDVIPRAYLLFDEPTAPLDLAYQLAFLSLIKDLAHKDAGVLLILHDINLAARFADEIILLKDGRVLANGQPDAVLTADNIRAGFGVEVELVTAGETRLIVASATRSNIAGQANPVDDSG